MGDVVVSGVLIYGLCDPRCGSLRYIGKTARPPQKRLRQHIVRSRKSSASRCARWVLSLDAAGLCPEIFQIEVVSADGWEDAEKFWIAYFKGLGVDLLNMTIGGGSTAGHAHSDETKRKLAALARRQFESEEARAIQRQKALKAWSDPEVRERSKASRKYMQGEAFRKKQSDAKIRLWATDEYRDAVTSAQAKVDRTKIAQEFWQRPEYRERQALARAKREGKAA